MTFTGHDGDIHTINFTDPLDKARHNRMVAFITQMLDLNKKLQDAKPEHLSPHHRKRIFGRTWQVFFPLFIIITQPTGAGTRTTRL